MFETPNFYHILMKKPTSHLSDYLSDHVCFSEVSAQSIAWNIIHALEFLHKNGICHGNVSLESILITSQYTAQMTAILYDFSLSFLIKEPPKPPYLSLNIYSAPEHYLGQELTEKIDIYALGVVFYMILTGNNPFKNMDDLCIAMSKTQEDFNFSGSEWNFISYDAVQMVQAMLSADPEMRPTASQCLAFEWMSSLNDPFMGTVDDHQFGSSEVMDMSSIQTMKEIEDQSNIFDETELIPINGAYF